MIDVTAPHVRPAVRASDVEREQTITVLQRSFADGRLTLAELEERAGAAYVARTRAQLLDLTADLPDADKQPKRPRTMLDARILCILLCVCPPAGVAYWLLSSSQTSRLQACWIHARRWQQLLAGAVVAGAGTAIKITSGNGQLAALSHLTGAVLVTAGVVVALPAISGTLHRAWVSCAAHLRHAARCTR
jgi:hypothetical protein